MNEDVLKNILKGMEDMSKRIRNLEAVELLMPGTTVLTATQTIPDSAWTTISFSSGVVGHGFTWAIGDPTNVYFTAARNTQRVLLVGRAQWESVPPPVAGARFGVHTVITRPGGNDTYELAATMLSSTGGLTQSWAFPVVFDSADMYTSLLLQAYQNWGGDADIDVRFGLFYIR